LNCQEADYERLIVAIADLPENELRLTAVLDAQLPSGGTPTGTAVKGVMAHLRKRLLAHPERKVALVLATDGLPGGCPGSDVSSIAGDLAAARMGNPSIPTYAIGVFDPRELAQGRPALEAFATAGGTGMPFVIEAASDLAARLQDALVQIRGSVLPCEFVIPPPADGTRIDYGKVNLKWKGTSTPEEIVPFVERAERCDPTRGGWYYDVPPAAGTPGRVIACEATCRQLNGDHNGTVSLTFGCSTRVIE
jgi:CO/xanthine dehydrogenase Mo-binding subunit